MVETGEISEIMIIAEIGNDLNLPNSLGQASMFTAATSAVTQLSYC